MQLSVKGTKENKQQWVVNSLWKCKGRVLSPGPFNYEWGPRVRWCGRSGDRPQSHPQQLEISEHSLAKRPSKSKHNELEVFMAMPAPHCNLWHHRSLCSERSICALRCMCRLVVQLQQGFLRHAGSDFRQLHIKNCSDFYCAQSYPILWDHVSFWKQKVLNMFWLSLLSMYHIKYAFGLDCIWMLDFTILNTDDCKIET